MGNIKNTPDMTCKSIHSVAMQRCRCDTLVANRTNRFQGHGRQLHTGICKFTLPLSPSIHVCEMMANPFMIRAEVRYSFI